MWDPRAETETWITLNKLYGAILFSTTSPHLLQLIRWMQKHCFVVKLQTCLEESRTSPRFLCFCHSSIHRETTSVKSVLGWIFDRPAPSSYLVSACLGSRRAVSSPPSPHTCWGFHLGTINKLQFEWHNIDVLFNTLMLTFPHYWKLWSSF